MNKKKIFGVFNLLDVIIIVIAIAVILPFVHYYIVFNEKGLVEQKMLDNFLKQEGRATYGFQVAPHEGEVDVSVSFKGLSKNDVSRIKAGDKESLPDGTVLSRIISLGQPVRNYYIADIGMDPAKACFVVTKEDGLYSIPAKVSLKGFVKVPGTFVYKGKDLRQLESFKFNSGSYTYDFVIEEGLNVK